MIERVDRLSSEPVVGHRYLVPTVRYPYYGITANWPVRGPLHEDREHLQFDPLHYHFDWRFVTAGAFRRIAPEHVFRTSALSAAGHVLCENSIDRQGPFPSVVWRPRMCLRAAPHFPHTELVTGAASRGPLFAKMWAGYVGHQCARGKSGWICPHRNVPLGSTPAIDGVITCPLHGLRIDAAAGVVLPVQQAEAKAA